MKDSNHKFDALVAELKAANQREAEAAREHSKARHHLAYHVSCSLGIETGKTVVRDRSNRYVVLGVGMLYSPKSKNDIGSLLLTCQQIRKSGAMYRNTTKILGCDVTEIEPEHYDEVQP